LKNKSIGGNTVILVTSDEKSSYIVGAPASGKSEAMMKEAGLQTLAEFNSNSHVMKQMITDDEVCLATLKRSLAPWQVRVDPTPAGLHEKRVENRIRSIKERRAAMIADLWYELPPELECESYMEAIQWINRLPNKTTGPYTTPISLFKGIKPFVPKYHFGQIGMFYDKREGRDDRTEWGIFIGYGTNSNYLRCYNPLSKAVTSKRKFVPMRSCPVAWNLKARLRPHERKPRTSSRQLNLPAQAQAPIPPAPVQQPQQPHPQLRQTAQPPMQAQAAPPAQTAPPQPPPSATDLVPPSQPERPTTSSPEGATAAQTIGSDGTSIASTHAS